MGIIFSGSESLSRLRMVWIRQNHARFRSTIPPQIGTMNTWAKMVRIFLTRSTFAMPASGKNLKFAHINLSLNLYLSCENSGESYHLLIIAASVHFIYHQNRYLIGHFYNDAFQIKQNKGIFSTKMQCDPTWFSSSNSSFLTRT